MVRFAAEVVRVGVFDLIWLAVSVPELMKIEKG
jgi:hypothetical protein